MNNTSDAYPIATSSPSADPSFSWLRDCIPTAGLVVAMGALLSGLTIFLDTAQGYYIVVGASSVDVAGIVFRAGGGLVNATALPNMVIAASVDEIGFPAALRAEGAWFVLPAPAAGCLQR